LVTQQRLPIIYVAPSLSSDYGNDNDFWCWSTVKFLTSHRIIRPISLIGRIGPTESISATTTATATIFGADLRRGSLSLGGQPQHQVAAHFHLRYLSCDICHLKLCCSMVKGLLILLGCQLVGELIRQFFSLPLPGPVIGMFLLAVILLRRRAIFSQELESTARTFLQSFGLLFVPAGVGAFANLDLIRSEWLPIAAGLLGSTVLSLAVTAFVMHAVCSRSEAYLSTDADPVSSGPNGDEFK
jgi:holin-like protein